MKQRYKTILIGAIFLPLLTSAAITIDSATSTKAGDETVFICTGPQSKRYHNTAKCRGLGSCSKKVIPISKKRAISMGRTPCGWCYD